MSILCEKMMSLSMKNDFMTNQIYIFPLLMDNSEKDKLIEELNQLSSDSLKNKQRMIEIAKILLTEHYKYLPKKKNQT